MKRKMISVLIISLLISIVSGCSDISNYSNSSLESISHSIDSASSSSSTTKSANSTSDSITPAQSTSSSNQTSSVKNYNTTGKPLTVYYIDVGQGDSILIQTPNGKNMLIDAGENSSQSTLNNYLAAKGVKKIDVLVATHPHADHIGGMAYIISNFDIGSIYMPKATATTKTYETLLTTIKNKGLSINSAKSGVVIDLDSALTINMVAPVGADYDDLNQFSAVIKITYKNNSFLFTGDAGNESEVQIINSGANIKADVLKVGHHGSVTATSTAFLKAITPKYAVISVGKGNSYGHPTQITLDRLMTIGAKIYRTDDGGTVVIESDGQNITVNRNASTYNSQAPPQSSANTQLSSQITQQSSSSATPNSTDIIVYKTKTGTKYHLDGCSYLSSSKIAISLSDAKSEGLSACSRCNPPH